MKKIGYIIILCLLFAACTKSIEIVYDQTMSIVDQEIEQEVIEQVVEEEPEEEPEQNLVGVWDGTIDCTGCCSPKYRYTLTITKHELVSELIEGSLKISGIPDQQYFAVFKLDMKLKGNELIIKTIGKTENTGTPKPGCGRYCSGNTYELVLSEDKTKFNGDWVKSYKCSVSDKSTLINIEKQ
ncbi:hypothetical protein [Tenacibaculum finnmarkense]|uniref:Lipoprotein n=1 Tax=Tenacibaculum finnmarkense genomovar ulcerans TaxID=2781388 RepID=A0A2I2MAX3_9FLAO|nr:hypothetical protein [Tenacibaculum finnmarkense]MBE7697657.1 hypothetical protein [Tenacibaculum finnmarkense genomovar ulcerans]SOU89616.1 conserved exported hypothetical protein [Tenacibaculum finnmarkense genomovar ulcerans]